MGAILIGGREMHKEGDALGPIGIIGDKEYWWDTVKNKMLVRIPDVREAIQAPPKYKILSADYSQVEIKIMAYLSHDKNLIEAINSGKDVHSYNAWKVFGTRLNFTYEEMEQARKFKDHPRHTELSKIRSNIKTTSFGVPYGAGASRIAMMTGMEMNEAEGFIETFFDIFSDLKKWIDNQGVQACHFRKYPFFETPLGYSSTPDGRKRFMAEPERDSEYDKNIKQIKRWAGNQPIQSTNVTMLKRAMANIYRDIRGGDPAAATIFDARFLLAVHDEIVMQTLEEHVDPVKAIMERRMNEAYWSIIPRWDKEDPENLGFNLQGESLVRMPFGVLNRIDVVVSNMWEKA
jgi:DNA polymerase-1